MAAVFSRSQAVVGHNAAAYLLDFAGFTRMRPVLIVPKGSNTRSDLARVIESDQFGSLATTKRQGIPVTTAPETLLSARRRPR